MNEIESNHWAIRLTRPDGTTKVREFATVADADWWGATHEAKGVTVELLYRPSSAAPWERVSA
jgi:hypothetical protein